MSEPHLPITDGLSIIAEPEGNLCRLTIRLSWDALEDLIASVIGRIEPYKRAETLRQRQAEDARDRMEERIAASKVLGATILAEITAKQAEGLSHVEATKAVAAAQNLAPSMVGILVRFAKKDARDARDGRILAAALTSKQNREIAEAEGLAPRTVARILRKLRDQAEDVGAGAGSRPFSGDRAPRARRKGLEAAEATPASPQRDRESKRSAAFPVPLPTGEVRGRGGKALAEREAHNLDGDK